MIKAVALLAVLAAVASLGALAGNPQADALSPTNAPCDLVLHLVLDGSGSMNPTARAQQAKAVVAAVQSIRNSRPNAKLFYVLYSFGDAAGFSITKTGQEFKDDSYKQLTAPSPLAAIDPMDVGAVTGPFTAHVNTASNNQRFVRATCHACALELALANLRRLKAKENQWAGYNHAVLVITDGGTNRNTATPMPNTAIEIKKLGVLGLIFVGSVQNVQQLGSLATVDTNKKPAAPLYATAANFGAVAEKLQAMIDVSCNPPQPETKEVCDPLYVAVLFDLSKSMLDSFGLAAAPNYHGFVENVAKRLEPGHSRLGVFGFAGSTYVISEFANPPDAVVATRKLHLGLTSKHDLPGVTDQEKTQIAQNLQKSMNKPSSTASPTPYAVGLGRPLQPNAQAPALVAGKYQPLETKTLHASAVRRVHAEMKAKAPANAKLMLLLVTDGGAYTHTEKCNLAFSKLESATVAALPKGVTMASATALQRAEAHEALMCYETLPSDHPFTAEYAKSQATTCPGLTAEFEASTCCSELPDCDLKGALLETKLPTAVTFIGDVWYSDTTVARVREANIENGFKEGMTSVSIRNVDDIPKAAIAVVADGPMIRNCRQVPTNTK